MVATKHDNNMVATQHGSSTKHGTNITGLTDNHTKDKKVETTTHHEKRDNTT